MKVVEAYRDDLTVVCECCFNWYWLADACLDAGIELVLDHALYLKDIHGGKNKTDRRDTEKLASLELLPLTSESATSVRPTGRPQNQARASSCCAR